MKNEIAIAVVRKNDEVLVVRRKQKEGDLFWQFPGGGIEPNETDEQAVIRELKEETGVEAKIIKCLGEREHPYTHKFMSYWACEFVSGDIVISDDDLDKAEWVNIDKVLDYFATPVYPPIIEYLKI